MLLLLIPPVVFFVHGVAGGMGAVGTLAALAEQYTMRRNNLAVVSLLGALPLTLLPLVLWLRKRLRSSRTDAAVYALGGALPILAVAVFVNHEYWSRFLPARQFLGFPHGLEFIIGPFVYAPIGILIGLSITWLLRRRS